MQNNKLKCSSFKVDNLKELLSVLGISPTQDDGKKKTARVLCAEIASKSLIIDNVVDAPYYDEVQKKALVLTRFKYIVDPMLQPAANINVIDYIIGEPFEHNGTTVVKVKWNDYEPTLESLLQVQRYEKANGKLQKQSELQEEEEEESTEQDKEDFSEEAEDGSASQSKEQTKKLFKEDKSENIVEPPSNELPKQITLHPKEEITELPKTSSQVVVSESEQSQSVVGQAPTLKRPLSPSKPSMLEPIVSPDIKEPETKKPKPNPALIAPIVQKPVTFSTTFGGFMPPPPPSMLTALNITKPKPTTTVQKKTSSVDVQTAVEVASTSSSSTTSLRPLPQVAGAQEALKKDIEDAVKPCAIGQVDRKCLNETSKQNNYTVSVIDPDFFGNLQATKKELLGEGTYGKVYRLGTYAVKVFLSTDEKEIPKYDLREIVILRNLIHPNVVYVYQVATQYVAISVRKPGFVMPLYKTTLYGVNLILQKEKRAEILYQLMRAVAFIHSRGVWHRDIKPGNILYNPDENKIALADFGMAQGLAIANNRHDTVISTVYYRAPEIFLNVSRYSSAVDVWSVGATWLDLLGHLFFRPKPDADNKNDFHVLQLIFATVGEPNNIDKSSVTWGSYQLYNIQKRYYREFSIEKDLLQTKKIDQNEYEVLFRLLRPNANERITAQQALNYRYFDKAKLSVELRLPANPLPLESLVQCGSLFIAMEPAVIGDYTNNDQKTKDEILQTTKWLHEKVYLQLSNHISVWFLAISLFHRYLSAATKKTKKLPGDLKTAAVSCYAIATKLDADYNHRDIMTAKIVSQFTGTSVQNVIVEQENIYRVLDLDFDRPTILTFLERMAQDAKISQEKFSQIKTNATSYTFNFDILVNNPASKLAAQAIRSADVDTKCIQSLQSVFPSLF